MNLRLNFIFIFILIIMTILLSRVYFLSIKSNTYYEELSKRNYIKKVNKVPVRGTIEDRNGKKLAVNEMGFSILIRPHLNTRKNKERLMKSFELINKHFPKLSVKRLMKNYKKIDSVYKHDFVKVVDYIPYDEFFSKFTIFDSKDDIKIESSIKRFYPYNKVASHIIGYVGKASKKDIEKNPLSKYSGIIGKNGLEKYYNEKLQRKNGL